MTACRAQAALFTLMYSAAPHAMTEFQRTPVQAMDSNSDCSMEGKPLECRNAPAIIRAKYPNSQPRVDLCIDKTSRYEATAEIMKALQDGQMLLGTFRCEPI
jgi:biopolymer transport protein ExbD